MVSFYLTASLDGTLFSVHWPDWEMIKGEIKEHVNSVFSSISYRFHDVVVDPGDEWEGFAGVKFVLLTHGHFDHIYGLNKLLELNPETVVYTNAEGRAMLLSDKKNLSKYTDDPFEFAFPEKIVTVSDGDTVAIGCDLTAKAIFTPGHNPSCVTWVVGDDVFSGDSYIPGIKPVTNLPKANKEQAAASEALIKQLAIGKRLHPGHAV